MPDPARSLYEALRALEHRAVTARRTAGLPSSRRAAAAVAQKPPYGAVLDSRRISAWLPDNRAAAQVPRAGEADKVWALVRVWAGWAGDPPPAQRYWMDLIEAAQPVRVRASAQAGGVGWLIGDLADPFALEVHRPIEIAARQGAAQLPVLPPYVPRDHDRRLAEVLSRAEGGNSAIRVLVGGSSTGKTRACWEMVQALPEGWRLWHPIFPGRAEAFLAGLDRVGPRTVVWLNDAQFYLLPGDPLAGERVAAGLRDLLRNRERAPVLVLGTIWPRYWQTLTAPPSRDSKDPHPQARVLLEGAGIEVPGTFTGPALAALAAAARADPRLAAAEQAEEGHVTQFLAGVPVLLERYHTAPPVARAVIHAAIDARMLGHGPALPHALLQIAAPGYLTDQEWEEDAEEDWLEQALAYTAAPCRGARGPLTRIRPRPGHPAPAQPRYRLADYLEQTRRADRGASSPPALLWDALLAHAARENLSRIARQAQTRGLYRYAFDFYAASAEAGDPGALLAAAGMLAQAGRAEEAIVLYQWAAIFYQRSADADDTIALRRAARMMREAGRADEAITFYQRAAEAGDTIASRMAARMMREAGRAEEAITWLRSRADAGDTIALEMAAEMLQEAGRPVDVIAFYQQAADAGDAMALAVTAEMLQEAGRAEEAITWLRSHADVGDPIALEVAAEMLQEAGRTDEAIIFYQRAAEADTDAGIAGDAYAWRMAAGKMWEAGQAEEAITWLRSRADAGDTIALGVAAELMSEAGQADEAITFYQRAADSGDIYARELVAGMMREAGRAEEAITWLRSRADAGDAYALRLAAGMLREAGRAEEAITWLRSLADAGDTHALRLAAGMLREAGRADEAIIFYQRAAESDTDVGDAHALRLAAGMMREAGRAEEAITWLRSRADAGDTIAPRLAAGMLREAGRAEEAITWLRSLADAGDTSAPRLAAEMLQEAGQADEAIIFYQRAAEAGDAHALELAAGMMQKVGRSDEAARLRRYGIEPGGQTADPWEANFQE